MNEVTDLAIASQKLEEVNKLVSHLAEAEEQLERGYGRLAFLLKEVSENRYWEGPFKSFGDYFRQLGERWQLGRAQLYNYMSVARDLDGDVTEEQLNTMGISKALVLRDAKNQNPTLPEDAMISALDPKVTVKDLKEILFTAKEQPTAEEGEWLDMEFEFMVTPSERQILESACNAARHGDPTINDKQKPSAQKKDIALKLAMEYLSAYSGDIIEGGKGI